MANITGDANNNILTGTSTADVIDGLAGNDNITGDLGDDTINAGLGKDTVDGGDNNDLLIVNYSTNTYTGSDSGIFSSTSSNGQGESNGYFFVYNSSTYNYDEVNFSNINNFQITGTGANDDIYTGSGNDTILGGAGNDTLDGQAGNDSMTGGAGNDSMTGGAGNDIYVVDSASDIITETSNLTTEIDTVESVITYTLGTNVENLTLTGTTAINGNGNNLNNAIVGNNAANTLNGAAGDDTMTGGAGNDIYIVNTLNDTVNETSTTATEIDAVSSSVTYTLGNNVENLTLTGIGEISGTGNTLNNTIVGNTKNNTLNGAAGNDTMTGGIGNDTYIVDAAGDTVTETSTLATEIDTVQAAVTYTLGTNLENLTLTGTAINGTGNALNNTITGNAANNILSGGAGIDTLIGGAGDDSYTVDATTEILTENTNEGTDSVSSSVTYTLGSNLENLTLTGTTAINGTGNELNNTITGNTANNTLSGAAGIDTLIGGAGDDSYLVDTTTDTLTEIASQGTDSVSSSVTYTLGSNLENLILTGATAINGTGNALNNTITGNSANNTLSGDAGIDTLVGGAGDDTYLVDTTTEILTENANEGTDSVSSSVTYTLGSNLENLTLTGTTAINGTGNALDNTITGNTANNNLSGGAGIDTLIGGAGNDTYVVDTTTETVTENANEGTDSVSSSVTYTLGSNLENLTLTGTTAINGTGNALDNIITGNTANNALSGGAGNDTYVVDAAGDTITENASEGTDSVSSSVTYTLASNIENLTLTGTTAINGTGNALNNTITGNSANNTLSGGDGIDTLVGGAGDDTYLVDTTTDTLTEIASQGTDSVSSSVTYTLGSNIENLTLTGTTAINGTGNTLNNTITGNSANNTLSGDAGIDTLVGGAGDDTYIVDTTTDTLTEIASEGTDSVSSSVTYTLGSTSNLENLTLTGTTAINGTGNTLNNTITGNTANNTLSGGTGIDTLVGGAGDDTYIVDTTTDTLTENLSQGTDSVSSSVTYTLGNNLENLTLTGTTAIDGTGNALNNTITGNTANNTLSGGTGNDTMTGGTGNDTYIVDALGDTVTETSTTLTEIDSVESNFTYTLGSNLENLTLTGTTAINGTGNALNNTITGNTANNTLSGAAGIDTLIGGDGDDTYIVDTTTDTLTENTSEGTDSVSSSVTYTLGSTSNLENLTLTGTTAINGTGNALNNTITGNTANNNLTGGDGDDSLSGGTGNDTMTGGVGNDTYVVDAAGDTITENASEGTDTVSSSITYTLGSNLENLTLTGTTAINGTGNDLNNTITGNSANNTLSGAAGIDTLIGGAGDDTYLVDATTEILTENSNQGTDSVSSSVTYTLGNNLENLTLTGTTGINGTGNDLNNTITGNTADNTLSGNAGNDSLSGGAGSDTMTGGAGDDTYVVDAAGDTITENALEGTDTVSSSITYTLLDNLENLTLTGTGTINGTGNALNNTITGNTANNTLSGEAGTDTLVGGAGNDTYIIDTTTDTLTENPSQGTDSVNSSVTYTLGSNLENLTLTGTTAINGTGNTLNNVLTGNSANNILSGEAGIDTLVGGAGDDTYIIDTTTDTLTENASQGTDTVNSSVTYTLGSNLENLTLTGATAINGTGNTLSNSITGNSLNNILSGDAGTDTLIGGLGNDTYIVDTTTDTLTELASQGTDTVSSSVTYTLGSQIENLTLTGTTAINGFGNSLNNTITGNSGNNTLLGGNGDDSLTGGAGNDSFTGGAGSDQFIYDTNAAFTTNAVGIDLFTGFITGTDKIVLDKTTFTALTSIAGSGFSVASEFAVVSNDAAVATASELIVYSNGTGNLFYNQNGVAADFGSGGQFATLGEIPALSATDFILQA
jgi:Ca2+-binding RTX toxin-like protein